ncbi:MAG: alpha-L-fucosidase [Ruminococcaceae bacterium]|nr:alpha-L-fucosidase [Oscillospiraceae bacterium]
MAIPKPEGRIVEFEKMGFGMFVHWGLYSQLGVGEWTLHSHNRDINEYKKLKDTFTAEDFDAEKLVLTAKNAGCKYIVLTTRHHEGFSLYDTCGLSSFDAPHSPCGRDLVREYVDACRKYDIVPFFYHTTLDWYQPSFNEDFDSYLEYLRRSVEILCTNYGKIGGFWFDGNWSKPDADWKEDELYGTIRRYQPDAIIVNNTGLDFRGALGAHEIDSVTFEQGRPTPMNREGMDKYIAAEMCYTLNNHWGIGSLDFDYKPPKELIEALCDCRRVGANYLLNIGPTAQGGVDVYQDELMKIMGRWMSIYGEAVYLGKPCGVMTQGKHFALRGDDALYLFFYDLGIGGDSHVTVGIGDDGTCEFEGVKDTLSGVEWMDNGESLEFSQNGDKLCVKVTRFPYGMSTCVRVAKAKIK